MPNKYVIYTIITGKYNEVRQPLCVDDRFDYVLFSNDYKEEHIGVWRVVPIPQPQDISLNDNKRLSRYPKSHPETLLAEYDASLYIDGNVLIADKWVYDRVIELANNHTEYAGVQLLVTDRDDIYRHSFDMCVMKAENDLKAIEEMHALYKEGFPEHFDMNENNIMYRKHTERMRQVDELWWQWIVRYSFRDQFSFMYCLWKYDIPKVYFLPQGEDSRNSSHFRYISHNENPNVAQKKWVKQGLLEKLRNRSRTLSGFHYKWHCSMWLLALKSMCPKLCLIVGGLFSSLINLPLMAVTIIYRKIKRRI